MKKKTYILNGNQFDSFEDALNYATKNGWIVENSETIVYKGLTRVLINVKSK
ncbi:ETC complex I subunit [Dysgonomonas macrotermitis]|uniref:Uncharacterized protein n=1 Tax=Dysgonomonas macrotermitis TaxID=1346286 RepID=A0A1M5GKX6_9BACT|nr:ETC complex I subunit [Dysgonomonas macrotermitis]SHG04369.1 hypothetical protein SAMN05444362_11450 [Dysgonomonas macrotermitis]